MRKTLFIILITLIMAGCSRKQPCHETLLLAESMVDEYPDSVIQLLAPFNTDSLVTAQDSALYGLLFTEAIHRKGLTFNTDSLIAKSEDFFRKQGDNDSRLARSLLHHAIVRYSQQHYAEAFTLVKEAEEMAERLHDTAFSYELYAVLGDMYDNANDKTATLSYYHRSLDAARQAGNEQWTARMLNNLATTFDQLGERDSFMYCMQQVEPLLPKLDGDIRAVALCNLGSYQLKERDTVAAKQSLLQALQLTYLDKANLLLADIAKGEGDMNRAVDLWYQTLQAEELDLQTRALEQLISHFDQQQEHRRCSFLSQRLNRIYRSSYELSDRTGLHGMQQQYERVQSERRQYHLVIALLGVALLLLLLLLSLSYYHRWRMRRFNKLVSDISTRLTDMEQLRQKLDQQQQIDQQQQLLAADITARLRTLAQRGQPATEADWTALVEAYRQHCPQFLSMLSSVSSLQPRELNVCMLIRLRFQPSEVAVLTASSPQSVTNLRVRLLQKVFHQQGGARDFDEQLRKCAKTLVMLLALVITMGVSAQERIDLGGALGDSAIRMRSCRMGMYDARPDLSRAPMSQHSGNIYIGNRRQLVVLASFKDKDFTEGREAALQTWNKIFNAENYSEGMYVGSIHDYFMDQSYGQFNLTFDLYFVELPDNRHKYRSTATHDEYSQYMVDDIIDVLQSQDIDWSLYDWDGDSFVNQLLIIFAGEGMNTTTNVNTIWPHQWWLSKHKNLETEEPKDYRSYRTVVYGGEEFHVDKYCCVQEFVETKGLKTPFGTICHEYTHCFGFPDYYDTSPVVGPWDLMDYGCYNDLGFRPCNYSAHERMLMGWLTPVELTRPATIANMPALMDDPVAYIIRNDGAENEYYFVENRQQRGWDKDIPGSGIVVFHIDYSKDVWEGTDECCNTSGKKRYDIFHANNGSDKSGWGYPYVVTDSLGNDSLANDRLTNTSQPEATLNNPNVDGQKLMSKPITQMRVDGNGLASFVFMADEVSSVVGTMREQEPARNASAPIYDLQGRRLSKPSKGLYIQGKRIRY